jgi:hypothetical protein
MTTNILRQDTQYMYIFSTVLLGARDLKIGFWSWKTYPRIVQKTYPRTVPQAELVSAREHASAGSFPPDSPRRHEFPSRLPLTARVSIQTTPVLTAHISYPRTSFPPDYPGIEKYLLVENLPPY